MTTGPILLQIGGTVGIKRRSGIQRVTVELARALSAIRPIDFVRWDEQAGGLRYADLNDLNALFGAGNWPEGARLRPSARQAGRSFRDELEQPNDTWFLDPEIAYHVPGGLEVFSKSITKLREYGVRTAAIAYDMIPLKHPGYAKARDLHSLYMAELLRTDMVLAISQYTADEFLGHWRGLGLETLPPVIACPLPDAGFEAARRPPAETHDGSPALLMVGTVEPRKRQVAAIEALAAARRRSPAAAKAMLKIIGSLHPAVATQFRQLVATTPGVEYVDYAPQWMLASAFDSATATIFASEEEGFGLPIAESLARGVPCLCADFGAMAEVAAGGGCLSFDVRDPVALEDAIVAICEDRSLSERLRKEISRRRFRTWGDYAEDIVGRLETSRPALQTPASWMTFGSIPSSVEGLPADRFVEAAASDVLGFESFATRDAFVDRAEAEGFAPLLTGRVVVAPQPGLDRDVAEEVALVRRRRSLLDKVARVEGAYRQARSLEPASPPNTVFLRLVISTFNRRDFTVANVNWILNHVLRPNDGVEFVVLDSGSTDGAIEALTAIRHPRLKLVIAPTNTGMLGGWRDVAAMSGAEYVWVIGDDDFLIPDEFHAVLAALRSQVGIPLGVVNFGVYARQAIGVADRPATFIGEQRPLASSPSPSGVYRVNEIAGEHDNLFTAIYTIIWRADVLAAGYDYPFNTEPFVDLVESIPCTKILLETFAESEAYWHGPVAIVGNAHNGWSRHRPRWHGLLMPQALALAREVGVEPGLLQSWARTQHGLYDEAIGIAKETGLRPRLSEEEARLARVLFRAELDESWR